MQQMTMFGLNQPEKVEEMVKYKEFTYASAFAGIGGMTMGLEGLGGKGVIAWEYDPTSKRQYAQDAHKLLHPEIEVQGDICSVDTSEVPDIDLFCFTPPCFVSGTLITTEDGVKNIEDIDVGDRVLTHKNVFRDVVTPMTKETRGIFKLRVQGSPITHVTPEHPFYVREMYRTYNTINGKRTNIRNWREPQWVDAKDLKPNVHYVGFSENKESKNPHNITHEDAWLVGRFVADGFIRHTPEKNRLHHVVYCVGKAKIDAFKTQVTSYHVSTSEDRTVYKCVITDKRLMELCEAGGKGAENKRVPGFIMNLPNELLEAFLDGYMSGDGCVTNGNFQATSVSKELIFGLAQVVQKLYKVPAQITFSERPKTTVIEGRTVNQKDTWMIRFKKETSNPQHAVYLDGMLWCPVRELLWDDSFEGTVYNFEVADDNSYVANNMTVHNCQSFSVAGKRGGFEDTRGTLTFEALRIAKSKQPKVLFMENVKGLINHDSGNTMGVIINAVNQIGYTVDFNVLNSKYFDVAQNRERVYLIAVRNDLITPEPWNNIKGNTMLPKAKNKYMNEGAITFNFEWPEEKEVATKISDFLENIVDSKYYLSEDKKIHLLSNSEEFKNTPYIMDTRQKSADKKNGKSGIRVSGSICPAITASEQKDVKKVVEKVDYIATYDKEKTRSNGKPKYLEVYGVLNENGQSQTLKTGSGGNQQPKVIDYDIYKIRKLTPRECLRLQSVPEDKIELLLENFSDSRNYKFSGNGLTINVIRAIGERLISYL